MWSGSLKILTFKLTAMNMCARFRRLKESKTCLRNGIVSFAVLIGITVGLVSCGSTGSYWGVDQSYPVGYGHVYYGAYGGDGHHCSKHEKKRYKKYLKEREKYLKKLHKKHKKHHHHHDD